VFPQIERRTGAGLLGRSTAVRDNRLTERSKLLDVRRQVRELNPHRPPPGEQDLSVARVAFLTRAIAAALWTASVACAVLTSGGWCARVAGGLACSGAGLIALSVLGPDWIAALRVVDRPLNVASATETMFASLGMRRLERQTACRRTPRARRQLYLKCP
jgi:hypothetical protein